MKTTPASVKIAAILLVTHSALLVMGSATVAKQSGDWSRTPLSVIWLGVAIFLAGGLVERQMWAWWMVTLLGSLAGLFNLLRVVAYVMLNSSGFAELEGEVSFSPLFAGLAGIFALFAVILLSFKEAKASFEEKTPVYRAFPPLETPLETSVAVEEPTVETENSKNFDDDSDQKRTGD